MPRNKRKRQESNQQQQQSLQRPNPPPDPPKSLIRLLQKDSSVAKYFKSLQENLDYDVQKWKQRAKQAQEQVQQLTIQQQQQQQQSNNPLNKANVSSRRKPNDRSSTEIDEDYDRDDHEVVDDQKKQQSKPTGNACLEDDDDNNGNHRNRNSSNKDNNTSKKATNIDMENSGNEDFENAMLAVFNDSDDNDSDSSEKVPMGLHNVKDDSSRQAQGQQIVDKDHDNIPDDMFEFLSSSSSSRTSSFDADENRINRSNENKSQNSVDSMKCSKLRNDDTMAIDKYLELAVHCLKRVGISLVKEILYDNNSDINDVSESKRNNDKNEQGHNDSSDTCAEIDKPRNETEQQEAMKPLNNQDTNRKTTPEEQALMSDSVELRDEIYPQRSSKQMVSRSNHDVVADLFQIIKLTSKLKLETKRGDIVINNESSTTLPYVCYAPFMSYSSTNPTELKRNRQLRLVPCYKLPRLGKIKLVQLDFGQSTHSCPVPPHPVIQIKQYILTALVLLDAYYSQGRHFRNASTMLPDYGNVVDEEKEEDAEDKERRLEENAGSIPGMGADRCRLVPSLLSSLEGEIIDLWPVQDRSTRLSTTALHLPEQHENREQLQQDQELDQADSNQEIENTQECSNKNQYENMEGACGSCDAEGPRQDNANEITYGKSICKASSVITPSSESISLQYVPVSFGSKSYMRLSALSERCLLANLVTSIYLLRADPQSALDLLWRYVVATAPSLMLEDYPKFPPVLSLCVVEAMICPTELCELQLPDHKHPPTLISTRSNSSSSWLSKLLSGPSKTNDNISDYDNQKDHDNGNGNSRSSHSSSPSAHNDRKAPVRVLKKLNSVGELLALSLHLTAHITKLRLKGSCDDRITDISNVELAAYERLLDSETWLQDAITDYENRLGCGFVLGGIDWNTCHAEHLTRLQQLVTLRLNEILNDTTTRIGGTAGANQDQIIDDIYESSALLELVLILRGDMEKISTTLESTLSSWNGENKDRYVTSLHQSFPIISVACSSAMKELRIRRMEYFRQHVGSTVGFDTSSSVVPNQSPSFCHFKEYSFLSKMVKSLKSFDGDRIARKDTCQDYFSLMLQAASSIFLSCGELADGECAIKILQWLSDQKLGVLAENLDLTSSHRALATTIRRVSAIPTVRVINLERRADRLAAFMAQAVHERLLVVRGVTLLDTSSLANANCTGDSSQASDKIEEGYTHGCYAIDGHGRLADAERRLESLVDSSGVGQRQRLNKLVETHWRPSDLKPFDTDAPDSEECLVRISPSEKACALSHIATWKGVVRALTPLLVKGTETRGSKSDCDWLDRSGKAQSEAAGSESGPSIGQGTFLDRYRSHSFGQFQICGYARGSPMRSDPKINNCSVVTPVCLVLEDDAILVDRFVDRLESLLEELPRDFHFCSLGYSRPKTAPMVPFSCQLGVPTAFWYLTGYLISLDGAKYLLDQLPVRGPVDSWVGCSLCFALNWDNVFGQGLGVGVHSTLKRRQQHQQFSSTEGQIDSAVPSVSRKDLSRILQFRAFAALIPLCSQKVGGDNSARAPPGPVARGRPSKAGYRNWRQQRDTDITYSGGPISTHRR